MRRARGLLALVLAGAAALVPPAPARAWDATGHRAVAAVAEALIAPATRREVDRLLADDPEGDRSLTAAAPWADRLRDTPRHRPAWHYDNLPLCGRLPARATWCTDGECASAQVSRLERVLADRTRPLAERREALKWLVHLVGDLHQPLHAVTHRYVEGLRDAGGSTHDRGGNNLALRRLGAAADEPVSLHRLWDHELVGLALGLEAAAGAGLGAVSGASAGAGRRAEAKAGPVDGARQRARDAQQALIAAAARVRTERRAEPPSAWMRESRGLARRTAYRLPGFVCGEPPGRALLADEAYLQAGAALVRRQLALAGARLAFILDRRLGAGPGAGTTPGVARPASPGPVAQ